MRCCKRRVSVDPFPLLQIGFVPSEVRVCGCDVVDALMVPLVVSVIDEGCDPGFKITGKEVGFSCRGVDQNGVTLVDDTLQLWREREATETSAVLIAVETRENTKPLHHRQAAMLRRGQKQVCTEYR